MDPSDYDGFDDADHSQNKVLDEGEATSEAGQKRSDNNDKAVGAVLKLSLFTVLVAILLPLQFNPVPIQARWHVEGTDKHQLTDGSIPSIRVGDRIVLKASSESWNGFVCSYEWKFDHSPTIYPDSSISHLITNEAVSVPETEVQCINSFGVAIGKGRSLGMIIDLSNNR